MPLLLVLTATAALIDWIAVGRGWDRVEEVAKPLVPLLLIAWVLTRPDTAGDGSGRLTAVEAGLPGDPTAWVVAALALGLVGDVLLLPRVNQFIGGLAAFLLGHLAYLPPLLARRDDGVAFLLIALVLGGIVLTIGRRIVAAAFEAEGGSLALPVAAYIAVVASVAVLAAGTLDPLVAIGGVLFATSDAAIGWTRFVRRETTPASRIFIHVTYHLAQFGLATMVLDRAG